MKISMVALLLAIAAFSLVHADEHPAHEIGKYCSEALDTLCRDVTPGKGRVLSCLYAYSDQLAVQCREAVVDAAEQVTLFHAAAAHVKSGCGEDVQRFCRDITPGDGRILVCLEAHAGQLGKACKSALDDVGLGN